MMVNALQDCCLCYQPIARCTQIARLDGTVANAHSASNAGRSPTLPRLLTSMVQDMSRAAVGLYVVTAGQSACALRLSTAVARDVRGTVTGMIRICDGAQGLLYKTRLRRPANRYIHL